MATLRRLGAALFMAATLVLVLSVNFASGQVAPETLGGSVTFRDSAALSDSLVISLTGVPQPASGRVYEGWLVSTGGARLSVGVLTVSSSDEINQTYVSPDGTNLLTRYNGFEITAEPASDSNPAQTLPALYSDSTPDKAFTHVGHLVVRWPSNPDGKGIATALREQALEALNHANLAKGSTTLSAKQQHAHHVINIIEGSGGANFDASFGNPGNGVGVLKHAADAITHANLAKQAAPDDADVAARADAVIAQANSVIDLATQARDSALSITSATADNIIVRLELDNVVALTGRAYDGGASLGGSAGAASDTEGGAVGVYTNAQDINSFVPAAGELPITGDTTVPAVALGTLMAGFGLVALGGIVLFRRRQSALA